MKIAKLNYNKIEEILDIEGDQIPPNINGYQYIDITNISLEPIVGSIYLGNGLFGKETRYISILSFRNRFTTPEKIAIDNYLYNPNLNDEQKAILTTILKDFYSVKDNEIDLLREDLQQGIYYIESCGLISPGRAMEVLQ